MVFLKPKSAVFPQLRCIFADWPERLVSHEATTLSPSARMSPVGGYVKLRPETVEARRAMVTVDLIEGDIVN